MVEASEVTDAVVAMLRLPGLCAAEIDLSAGMVARWQSALRPVGIEQLGGGVQPLLVLPQIAALPGQSRRVARGSCGAAC
jgi:hypothetical protein